MARGFFYPEDGGDMFLRNVGSHIPEDGILHSHRRENLKSYMVVNFFKILLTCPELLRAEVTAS
jgi:hypothetical protein